MSGADQSNTNWAESLSGAHMVGEEVHRRRQLVRQVVRRGWLVCSSFSAGLAVSALAASAAGHLNMTLAILPLAGPFAEPMASTNYSFARVGIHGGLLLLAIGSHPMWPGPGTACLSLVAMVWWMLAGLSQTYAGV